MRRYTALDLNTLNLKDAEVEQLKAYFSNNPVTLDSGYLEIVNDATNQSFPHYYVQLGSLIDSLDNETIQQREIDPARVKYVLMGKSKNDVTGLIYCGKILVKISIGYLPDEDTDEFGNPAPGEIFTITSGRHRLVAMLMALQLSGHSLNDPRVRALKVDVVPGIYDSLVVLAQNMTRTVQKNEVLSVNLQSNELDPLDFGQVIAALRRTADEGGKVPGVSLNTTVAQGFVILRTKAMQELLNNPGAGSFPANVARLKTDTLMSLGSAYLTKIKAALGATTVNKGLKNDQYLIALTTIGLAYLGEAIEKAMDNFDGKGKNIARNTSTVAIHLANIVAKKIKSGEITLPTVPTAERKPRGKKAKSVEEAAAPPAAAAPTNVVDNDFGEDDDDYFGEDDE